MEKQLIFQIGVRDAQNSDREDTHQDPLLNQNHAALSTLDDVACYSVWPGTAPESDQFRIHYPEQSLSALFSSIGTQGRVDLPEHHWTNGIPYKSFEHFVEQAIREIETLEERALDLIVCYGNEVSAWVVATINARRLAQGLPETSILYVTSGDAQPATPDFNSWLKESGLFGENSPIHVCTASSSEGIEHFSTRHPDYPADRLLDHQPGYNASLYRPDPGAYSHRKEFLQTLLLHGSNNGPTAIDVNCEKIVAVNAYDSDQSFLEAVITAAQSFEASQNAATLLLCDNNTDVVAALQKLAYEELHLQHIYFLRPQKEEVVAKLNAMSDVGIQLVRNPEEVMSLLQFLGCGTPVVAYAEDSDSGIVDDDTGRLILPCKQAMLTAHLDSAINEALESNWKISKGSLAATVAMEQYSRASQCEKLLREADYCIAHSDSFTQHPDLLRQSILY